MTKLLEKALKRLRALPDDKQDQFAGELLARLAEEAEWEALTVSDRSQDWLEQQVKKLRNDARQGLVKPLDCP